VLDNGADTIKAGFVTTGDQTGTADGPRVIPNCLARDRHRKTYVGSELEKCRDFGELAFRRPVEKGFVVSWEAQKEIWDREFFDDKAPRRCDPSESRLVLAEQPNGLPALQTHCDQMVFEEFGFASYYRGIGQLHVPLLSRFGWTPSDLSGLRPPIQVLPSTRTKTSKPSSTHQGHRIPPLTYRPRSYC
jgi:actin-related protein